MSLTGRYFGRERSSNAFWFRSCLRHSTFGWQSEKCINYWTKLVAFSRLEVEQVAECYSQLLQSTHIPLSEDQAAMKVFSYRSNNRNYQFAQFNDLRTRLDKLSREKQQTACHATRTKPPYVWLQLVSKNADITPGNTFIRIFDELHLCLPDPAASLTRCAELRSSIKNSLLVFFWFIPVAPATWTELTLNSKISCNLAHVNNGDIVILAAGCFFCSTF